MEVPGLGNAIEHQGMTPLTKALGKERISRTNDLSKKTTLIRICFQIFENDPVN
jgi:hypothetical protein